MSAIVAQKRWKLHANVASLVPSPTLAINEQSARLIAAGKTVYRLGFGQSPFPVPPVVADALRAAAEEKDYLPVKGLPLLRKKVADWHQRTLGLTVEESQVMIGPGSKQLIYSVLQAIDAPLLLPAPSWVSYEPQAHLLDKEVHWLTTSAEDQYCLTAATLAGFCEKNAIEGAVLLLNYPNNPSGTTYHPQALSELAMVCRRHGLLVISDEIYGALHFTGQHESIARFYPEGTIITGGLSKWAGAGGWRLGTMVVPPQASDVLSACAKIASETFSAVSAPIQHAAVVAYEDRADLNAYLSRSRAVLQLVAGYVHKRLAAMQITAPAAQGGFYLMPDFEHYRTALAKNGIHDSASMCADILTQTGVALLPGSAFGVPAPKLKVRLAFVDFDGAAALSAKKEMPEAAFITRYSPRIKEAMDKLEQYFRP